MISSMSKGDEANREVSELKRACYGIRGERERERERERDELKEKKNNKKEEKRIKNIY